MTDYAHITHTDNGWVTQSIQDHCAGTAALAKKMACAFGAGDWAYLCGCWHDIGKYSKEFQSHIIFASGFDISVEDPGKVDHATAGALYAREKLKNRSLPLVYCICGHHSGLMDYIGDGRSNLRFHLSSQVKHYLEDIRQSIPHDIDIPTLESPKFDSNNPHPQAWHLWIRMLFSCLVDADWLDTEKFMRPDDYRLRGGFATLQ